MQEDEVNHCYGSDNEGEKEMKCEESGEGGVVNGKASSDSLDEGAADVGNSGKEVGNNSGTSERHLTSGKDIAYESGYYG